MRTSPIKRGSRIRPVYRGHRGKGVQHSRIRVERMESCRQSMIIDTNHMLDELDQLEADFQTAADGINEIIEKLQWVVA